MGAEFNRCCLPLHRTRHEQSLATEGIWALSLILAKLRIKHSRFLNINNAIREQQITMQWFEIITDDGI